MKASNRASGGNGKRARVYAVTSGKGGVGKSTFSVNLAVSLNRAGLTCLLIDADMGLANVDLMTGVSSKFTLEQVMEGQSGIFDALAEGPEALTVLPAGTGLERFSGMDADKLARFKQELLKLENAFDLIFVDTGAGISANVTDFVFMADEVIIIMTPEPTAFADAYAMAKLVFAQKPDAAIGVVMNMSRSETDSEKLAGKFAEIVRQFLKKNVLYHGAIANDPAVPASILRQEPLALHAINAPAMKSIRKIARNLLGLDEPQARSMFNR
jgi:flagellar biosynthesis protein FlhG